MIEILSEEERLNTYEKDYLNCKPQALTYSGGIRERHRAGLLAVEQATIKKLAEMAGQTPEPAGWQHEHLNTAITAEQKKNATPSTVIGYKLPLYSQEQLMRDWAKSIVAGATAGAALAQRWISPQEKLPTINDVVQLDTAAGVTVGKWDGCWLTVDGEWFIKDVKGWQCLAKGSNKEEPT